MKHVKTKRLSMYPMTIEEMKNLINAKQEKVELQAVLDHALENPSDYKWSIAWKINLKEEGTQIGYFLFKGLDTYTIGIDIDIEPDFRKDDYAFEALEAMANWALSQDEIYFLEATPKDDEKEFIDIITRLKFKEVGDNGNKKYLLEKPKSHFLIIFTSIGLCIGCAIGISLGYTAIGIAVGICLGAVIGFGIDINDEDKRKECKEKHNKE